MLPHAPEGIQLHHASAPLNRRLATAYSAKWNCQRNYARNHGLTLDTSLTFHDEGVSAFRGKNREQGALRQFIEAVDTGKVPSDSWLLVESLDRLSRSGARPAYRLLDELLEKGLTVVTLTDNRAYSAATMDSDPMELLVSLLVFARAHEESATKSKRVAAAWEAKQKEAAKSGKPTTARCPTWLRLSDDRSEYVLNPERAEVVRRVYEMAGTASMGQATIVKQLNSEGVPTFGPSQRWATSTLNRLLSNRATVGEYQPTTLKDGMRGPAGGPVRCFYPAVITEELFLSVQEARNSRQTGGRGRKGKSFTNLFTGLAKCTCGAPLHYLDKSTASRRQTAKEAGRPPKHHRYLVCSSAKLGDTSECKYSVLRYDILEPAILSTLTELNFETILRDSQPDHQAQEERLIAAVAERVKRLADNKRQVDRYVDAIGADSSGELPAALVAKISALEKEHPELEADLEHRRALLASHRAHAEQMKETVRDFRSAYAAMQSEGNSEQRYQLRATVHHILKSILAELVILEWPYDPEGDADLLPIKYEGFFSPPRNGRFSVCFTV